VFKRFGFNTSTVGHTTLKVLAGVTLMYAEKGDKMVLLPFTLEVLVVMTVWLRVEILDRCKLRAGCFS